MKLPKLLNLGKIKSVLGSDIAIPYVGQGLAQIPKAATAALTTDLGHKAINTITGIVGNILNERFSPPSRQKRVLREFFTNLMFTWNYNTATVNNAQARNVEDFISALRSKSMGNIFGSLLEEPQTVVGAAKNVASLVTSRLGGNPFKSLSSSENIGFSGAIKEITPKISTVFEGAGNFASKLTEKDLITY